MKKISLVAFLFLTSVLLSACTPPWQKKAALQVNSIPKATVYIEGEEKGTTPFEDKKLSPGEITLKLVPEVTAVNLNPWEKKIKLVGGVMTVVNWEFGQNELASAGEVLTLEKTKNKETASMSVVSIPDAAVVRLDGEARGFTPLNLDQITAGEREIVITTNGFQDRSITAKLVNGYELIANVKLAKADKDEADVDKEEEKIDGDGDEEENDDENEKTTPTPKKETTPTPTPSGPTPTPPERPYVEIKDTPTGWLKVRSEPSTAGGDETVITKIDPGDTYPLLDEDGGWYQIEYEKDETGWISGKYAEKYE